MDNRRILRFGISTNGKTDAAGAADRLFGIADGQRGPYLKAAAALAQGRVCVASGQGDARACLHRALEGFAWS